MYTFLTKLDRSRWLDIGLVLFFFSFLFLFVLMDLDFVSVDKKAEKNKTLPLSSQLDLTFND